MAYVGVVEFGNVADALVAVVVVAFTKSAPNGAPGARGRFDSPARPSRIAGGLPVSYIAEAGGLIPSDVPNVEFIDCLATGTNPYSVQFVEAGLRFPRKSVTGISKCPEVDFSQSITCDPRDR